MSFMSSSLEIGFGMAGSSASKSFAYSRRLLGSLLPFFGLVKVPVSTLVPAGMKYGNVKTVVKNSKITEKN